MSGEVLSAAAQSPLLKVSDLSVSFNGGSPFEAVKKISFELKEGETLGILGESGAGKTQTALALIGLCEGEASGSVDFAGQDLLAIKPEKLRALSGNDLAIVLQDSLASLNPVIKIGSQIVEAIRIHQEVSKARAWKLCEELLASVEIPEPKVRARQYPHEFSGGMRQRAAIAMAIANRPKLLIADEPTTALDVTVQAEILKLLERLKSEYGMSLIFITHDLAVLSQIADRIAVIYQGQLVESGETEQIFRAPKHPHTSELIAAIPRAVKNLTRRAAAEGELVAPLLEFKAVSKIFSPRRLLLPSHSTIAADGVSFKIFEREAVGLVGESGSGKSTVGRLAVNLLQPSSGEINFSGHCLASSSKSELRDFRRQAQIVFQEPLASLDPRMTVAAAVAEPLVIHSGRKTEHGKQVAELLAEVGLADTYMERYPHQLSGGERQRVCIARALALRPKLVVLDEPVTALDMVSKAEILDLLADLRERHSISYLFISHDLAVVQKLCDRVAVMKDGQIVELTDTNYVFTAPQHSYTKKLLESIPLTPNHTVIPNVMNKDLHTGH